MINAAAVQRRRAPYHTVCLVALAEEKLRQVRTVLTSAARNQRDIQLSGPKESPVRTWSERSIREAWRPGGRGAPQGRASSGLRPVWWAS